MHLHTAHGRLLAQPPFDFARTLAFATCFRPCDGEQRVHDGALTKALTIGGRTIAFTVRAASDTADAPAALTYTLYSERPIDAEAERRAAERIRFQLSLDDDLEPLVNRAANDPVFEPIARAQLGHHHLKFPSPFEAACWAVLTQRTPIHTARLMKRAIVERFGGSIVVDGALHRAFPEPAVLAEASPQELSDIARAPRKGPWLVALSRAFAEVDPSFLAHARFGDVERWLTALPGMGPWSVAFVLWRALGRMEGCTLAGGPNARAVREAYGLGLADDALERIGTSYAPNAGYWLLYLHRAA